jgi:hypothetical protein
MPKAGFAAILCVLAAACGDGTSPPTDDPPATPDVFAGRWLLLTINGQELPAMNRVQNRLVLAGQLDLPTVGSSEWGYCYDSLPAPGGWGANVKIYDFDLDDGRAELWIDFSGQPPAIDTIFLSNDTLTWEYNLRSEPAGPFTDVLRFRRREPLQTGEPCRRPG